MVRKLNQDGVFSYRDGYSFVFNFEMLSTGYFLFPEEMNYIYLK